MASTTRSHWWLRVVEANIIFDIVAKHTQEFQHKAVCC
jgi:hypothetical protein